MAWDSFGLFFKVIWVRFGPGLSQAEINAGQFWSGTVPFLDSFGVRQFRCGTVSVLHSFGVGQFRSLTVSVWVSIGFGQMRF